MIYKCPSCGSKFQTETQGVVRCPSCGNVSVVGSMCGAGTDWDRAGKGRWTQGFFETLKKSLMDPVAFFADVGAGSSWKRPLAYALIVSAVVFCSVAAYQAGFQALGFGLELSRAASKAVLPLMAFSLPITVGILIVAALLCVPMAVTFSLLVQTCLFHLCLMILGAARKGFLSTFRVVCYAGGPQLFQIIPFLGGMVGGSWQIVLGIIGLKVVHGTTYGRSALAVFLPMILCCGLIMMVVMAIAGGLFAAVATGVVK